MKLTAKSILIGWLTLFTFQQTNAQTAGSTSYVNQITQDLKGDVLNVSRLGFRAIQSPITASSSDWLRIFYAGVFTSGLFLIDPETKDLALSNQSRFNNKIFKIDHYLRGEIISYASIGMYVSGLVIRHEKIRKTGLHAMESLLIAQSITAILKYSLGRGRPYGGKNHLHFRILKGSEEKYRSIPSGHTTGAFAFGSVLAKSIDNNYWKIFWYGSSVMVGMARIYHNRHWLSDTVLAGFIGYGVTNFVVRFSEGQENEHSIIKRLRLNPNLTLPGISLTFDF